MIGPKERCSCRGECGRDHTGETRVVHVEGMGRLFAAIAYDPDGAQCAADASASGDLLCGGCRARITEAAGAAPITKKNKD